MSQLSFRSDEHDAGEERAGYRGPGVCRIIGISYRQLDYWTRTGLVRASVASARGSGSHRLYSYRDLVEVKIIKDLLDAGLSLQRARGAVEYLREHLGEELATASLVIAGNDSLLARSDGEIVDLVKRGQGVLNVIPLSGMVEELDARIHELRPETEPAVPVEAGGETAAGG